ncbi:MAG: RtcB family protein [Acidobacteria bacterium]|nr:MAG: RtcB family protein [Acidobacteriota bacterium]
MKKVISTERIPIKLWLDDIEEGALEQARHLANLPFAVHHVAIMADSHEGYGMPIGGVLATENVIIPNAVGVDIGCGMCAVKTSLTEIDQASLKKIMGEIRKLVPVGFDHHKEKQDESLMPKVEGRYEIVDREYQAALKQIGTLGGGNHFIEIQKGSDGHIWIMVHSGSRNFGLKIAEHYNKEAVELNNRIFSIVPKKWDLAHLPTDSKEGQMYIREMQYCVNFAYANRKLMTDRIMSAFLDVLPGVTFEPMINIAHNYALLENHFGKNVWVHRKGATLATRNTIGIIPGSQGSKSYIVRGKGNRDSFQSCSHGAGRKLGRRQARRTLNLEEEKLKLDKQGIIHTVRGVKDLDEATGAYKDIGIVLANQEDLVEILVELSPLAVIKG